MALYAVDSVSSTPIIQRSAFGNYSDTTIITFGFACCLFSGLTRSFGMTMYRQIKSEVDPITVVFIHAVLTSFAALPVMRKYRIELEHLNNINFSCISKTNDTRFNRNLVILSRCLYNGNGRNI